MTRLSAITTALALVGAAAFSHGALSQTGSGCQKGRNDSSAARNHAVMVTAPPRSPRDKPSR